MLGGCGNRVVEVDGVRWMVVVARWVSCRRVLGMRRQATRICAVVCAVALFAPMDSQALPYLYIPNTGAGSVDGTVLVIDAATHATIATIPVGAGPLAVAVHPDGSRVYVANSNDYTVSVIDAVRNAVVATIAVGPQPVSLAVDPSGTHVYVAKQGGWPDPISVIDVGSNAVVPSIPQGQFPFQATTVAISPDGTTVYARGGNANTTIVSIDAATNTVTGMLPGGNTSAWGTMAVHPNGSRLYLSNGTVIDVIAKRVLPSLSGAGGTGIAVHPDGSRVFLAGTYSDILGNAGVLSVIGAEDGELIQRIPVCESPYYSYVSLSRSGRQAFVITPLCKSIWVIDTARNEVEDLISLPIDGLFIARGDFVGPDCITPGDCDDGISCTDDTCNRSSGCGYSANAARCNDGSACTADTCDLTRGCVHAPIAECVPALSPAARRCQAALAVVSGRFGATVYRELAKCFDAIVASVAPGAAETTCRQRLDPMVASSTVARARVRVEGRIAAKCAGVVPGDIGSPCDANSGTIVGTVACVLDEQSRSAQRASGATYRDACSMLAVVGLGAAFPAVCGP